MAAQETNVALIEALTVACLLDAPDTVEAFVLVAPDTLPYARAALTSSWRQNGKRVSFDAAPDTFQPTLRYGIDDVSITYRRVRRRALERSVSVALEYTLQDANGAVLDDATCRQTARDTVGVSSVARLEDPAYPESMGAVPQGGWLRRYVEPVVLTGAVAVGIFLFFSLRSTS